MSARLTPRERSVLAAVERRLTNPEIAAELFLSVRTVESHIASLRRKLGAESRGALIEAAGRKRHESVPVPANPLRGRDADLARLGELASGGHWVTVTGPGGVGKTRLALEFARSSERMPVVVELEHASVDDVAGRVARALGIEAVGGDPVPAIATALAVQPYLLVLDNIDRVGDTVGALVARLRTSAPSLRVITTSRTPVGDAGERLLALNPLDSAGPTSDAALLLLDRIGSVRRLDDIERAAVPTIAARLEGVPLALELAASVSRHLPLSELASRLETGFAALDRAAPAGRHRTLETAFDWTWDLLADDEREVVRRLAALPRSFGLELAEAVAGEGAHGAVLRLLDHSLLVATDDIPARFRMLAVLREFVHARTDPALIRDVRERHAVFLGRAFREFVASARTDDSPRAAARARLLYPQGTAALRWALAADHPIAADLAASMGVAVEQYGADSTTINALVAAGSSAWVRATATAEQLLALGVAIAAVDVGMVDDLAAVALERADSPRERLAAFHLHGTALAYGNRGRDAVARLAEAERLALELGQTWDAASISQMRAIALGTESVGEPGAALDAFETAMRRYDRANDQNHVHNSLYMMALLAADHGIERERAVVWARDAADYADRTANRHALAHARLAQRMLGEGSATPELLVTEFSAIGDLRCTHRSLMLRAAELSGGRRIQVLRRAVSIAESASDGRRRTLALTALAQAAADTDDRLAAFAALDAIAATDGVTAAQDACPAVLRSEYTPDSANDDSDDSL